MPCRFQSSQVLVVLALAVSLQGTASATPPTGIGPAPQRGPRPDFGSRFPPPVQGDLPPSAVATAPDRVLHLVGQRADQRVKAGFDLARRGALYAAQAEFIRALETVAYAHDGITRSTGHHDALVAGLKALEEVDDFAVTAALSSSQDLVGGIAAHRTPVMKDVPAKELSPIVATRRYCAYAQQKLGEGCGNVAAASRALYGLARIEMLLAQSSRDVETVGFPKAMVILEAALNVDPRNYEAANELGVLLAGYGQHTRARDLLLQSVRVHPTLDAWFNLSAVYRQLADEEKAQYAHRQYDILAQRNANQEGPAGNLRWVDVQAFVAQSPPDPTLLSSKTHNQDGAAGLPIPPPANAPTRHASGSPNMGRPEQPGGLTGLRRFQQRLKSVFE